MAKRGLGGAETESPAGDYREETLAEDARLASAAMLIGGACTMAFVAIDAQVITDPDWRRVALLSRFTAFLISAAAAAVLWRTERLAVFDRVATAWLFLALAATSIFNWSRPLEYEFYLVWNVILIMSLFYVIRVPLRWQLGGTALFLCSEFTLLVQKFGPDLAFRGRVWTFYLLLATVLGAVASYLLEENRKARWTSLIREREALQELRRAMEEVRTLRGILPVCAHCRSVRSPDGRWESMEVYVSRVTDSDFSHTLCPTCETEHYPELHEGDGAEREDLSPPAT